MSPHFAHHRMFLYLRFMLLDLHTYTSHYAPLRSRAIRPLVRGFHALHHGLLHWKGQTESDC